MITGFIEAIGIMIGLPARSQAFIQFHIENLEPQPLGCVKFTLGDS